MRRVHKIADEGPREIPATPAPDYLASGDAWARVQLLRDGRVIVDGKRGALVLDPALGDEVQAMMRRLGVRERAR